MDLLQYLRIQAHANRLANRRLHEAMTPLSRDDFHATRSNFFPSFALTLNHILVVDLYYVGALYREADLKRKSREFQSCETMAELALRQAASDMRLITFCNALNAEGADAMIDMDRSTYVQKERAGHVLAHLFMHQTHHRGQAHAMLSETGIKPPQPERQGARSSEAVTFHHTPTRTTSLGVAPGPQEHSKSPYRNYFN